MTTRRLIAIGAWCGPATVGVALIGWLIAGVLPFPLGPSSTQAQVVAFYGHHTRVLVGLVTASLGVTLVLPFIASVSSTMLTMERNAEAEVPALTILQTLCGSVTSVLLLVPMLLMATISFRPDRLGELTVTMNDLAWLLFLTPIGPFIVQDLAIAAAILRDPQHALPRWLGWLNLWVAVSFLPDPLAFLFHHGPFGWNGVIIFWLALTTYSVWLIAMGIAMATTRATERTGGVRWHSSSDAPAAA